jgi:hypothetical protein
MPTIGRELVGGNKPQCGLSIDIHYLTKRMNDMCTKSLLKPQGQSLMITKVQEVHLIRVRDTPVALSHNERTRDEHGNACVQ